MSLGSLAKPLGEGFSARFFTVSYLPTLAGAAFLLALVWAGAPGPRLHWRAAWQTAAHLGLGEVVALGLALTLAAVLTMPLQLSLVRLLEGYWPAVLAPVDRRLRAVQRTRRRRLADRARLPGIQDDGTTPVPTAAQVQAVGVAGTRLRQLFPAADHVLPTALGNALAAMEHQAGAAYGWDAVVAWPRLYPVLTDQIRAVVDDRRDGLDVTTRLTVVGAATAIGALALLLRSGWWLLLALLPLAVCWLAYLGAVRAAVAYGEAVRTAFDLGRFELLRTLHIALPADVPAERALAQRLCLQWRQGVQADLPYHHPDQA